MNTQNQALAQELADYATSLRSASMAIAIQLEGRNAPTSFVRCADLCERAATALKCADSAPHADIHIDFAQIGTAGPFPVENGRVSLPDATMVDLVQRLKPTINAAIASVPVALPEPVIQASQRDQLLQVALDFVATLTGMSPPPIEVAPPEVFAPFYDFVDRVQAITAPQPQAYARGEESEKLLRELYDRGYEDRAKERDYDPLGASEFDAAMCALRTGAAIAAAKGEL